MEYLPKELKYDNGYSWIKVEGKKVIVGIAKPLADATKEFVFIDLPELKEIKKGEVYVSLESVKWSGHLESPLSGKIVEVNNDLFNNPEKINSEPYSNWIMKLVDVSDDKDLMDADTKVANLTCNVK